MESRLDSLKVTIPIEGDLSSNATDKIPSVKAVSDSLTNKADLVSGKVPSSQLDLSALVNTNDPRLVKTITPTTIRTSLIDTNVVWNNGIYPDPQPTGTNSTMQPFFDSTTGFLYLIVESVWVRVPLTSSASTTPGNTNTITTYDMTDNSSWGLSPFKQAQSGYLKTNGLAKSRGLVTNAKSATITIRSTVIDDGFTGNIAKVSIYKDGVAFTDILATTGAATDYVVQLDQDGQVHTYEFINGCVVWKTDPTTWSGSYVTKLSVRDNNSSLNTITKKSNRLTLSTDSIIEGYGTTAPGRLGITAKLREGLPSYDVANVGYSGRSALESLNTIALRQAEADNVVAFHAGATRAIHLFQLGYNDAGKGTPLATFTNYILDVAARIHAANPAIICGYIAPYYSPNGDGFTPQLSAYGPAINSAISSANVGNYFKYVDTTGDITSANYTQYLIDDIHTNDVGGPYLANLLVPRIQNLAANTPDPGSSGGSTPTYSAVRGNRVNLFDGLVAGDLNGQNGWVVPSGCSASVDANGVVTVDANFTNQPIAVYNTIAAKYGILDVIVDQTAKRALVRNPIIRSTTVSLAAFINTTASPPSLGAARIKGGDVSDYFTAGTLPAIPSNNVGIRTAMLPYGSNGVVTKDGSGVYNSYSGFQFYDATNGITAQPNPDYYALLNTRGDESPSLIAGGNISLGSIGDPVKYLACYYTPITVVTN